MPSPRGFAALRRVFATPALPGVGVVVPAPLCWGTEGVVPREALGFIIAGGSAPLWVRHDEYGDSLGVRQDPLGFR